MDDNPKDSTKLDYKEACVSIRPDKFTAVLLGGNKARNSEKNLIMQNSETFKGECCLCI